MGTPCAVNSLFEYLYGYGLKGLIWSSFHRCSWQWLYPFVFAPQNFPNFLCLHACLSGSEGTFPCYQYGFSIGVQTSPTSTSTEAGHTGITRFPLSTVRHFLGLFIGLRSGSCVWAEQEGTYISLSGFLYWRV